MGSIDAYTRVKVLGRGSFGCAVLCERRDTKQKVVIKEIDMEKMPPAEREAALQEARVLASLHHPNIVRCHESFVDERDSKLYIVMDWAQEGDLYSKIRRLKGKLMSEREVVHTFTQICSALAYVHERKILHRDIKTQNVFLDEGGVVKLGDFGVAKVLGSTMALASTAVGTPYYLSPEICENRRYNAKSDMWSLGCVLYEMCTTRHAFDAASIGLLINKILRGRYPPISATYSKELRDLVARMLSRDAAKRPTASGIMGMHIVQRYIPLGNINNNANGNNFGGAGGHVHHHYAGVPNTPQAGIRRGSNVAVAGVSHHHNNNNNNNNNNNRGGGQEHAAVLAVLAHNNKGFEVRGKSAAMTSSSSSSPSANNNDDNNNPARLRAERERDAERRRQDKLAMERKRAEDAEARREEARRKREAREREMKRIEAERRRAEEMEREKERLEKQRKLAKQQARQQARQEQEERLKEFKRCQQQAIKNKQKHLDENDLVKEGDNDIEIFLPEKPKKPAPQQHERDGAQLVSQHNENISIDIVVPKSRPPSSQDVGKANEDRIRQDFFEVREAAKKNRERVLSDLAGEVPHQGHPREPGDEDVARSAASDAGLAEAAVVNTVDADVHRVSALVLGDGDKCVGEEERAAEVREGVDADVGRTKAGVDIGDHVSMDDEDEPSPISKFVLNGRTLELPNVNNESDSAHTRVEALRQFLEKELGLDAFLEAYRILDDVDEEVDDDFVVDEMERILGPEKMGFIGLIHQLLISEEYIFHHK